MSKPRRKPSSRPSSVRVTTTDVEIDAAIARAKVQEDYRPQVTSARYRATGDAVVLRLATGVEVAIPRSLLQGLQDATPKELGTIEIEGPGTGLHWPALDVDHYVPALLAGVFGTRHWMAELGQKGGKARSPAKAAASRANGRRGGRPRKDASHRAA
jgi:hypothetical protein